MVAMISRVAPVLTAIWYWYTYLVERYHLIERRNALNKIVVGSYIRNIKMLHVKCPT